MKRPTRRIRKVLTFLDNLIFSNLNLLRKQLSYLINLALIILTLGISILGFLTYKDLNIVTQQLSAETQANPNFHRYKEIMMSISRLEDLVDTYQLKGEKKNLQEFDQQYQLTLSTIDSLKALSGEDLNHKILTDSLLLLFGKYHTVLIKLSKIKKLPVAEAFSNLDSGFNAISSKNQENQAEAKYLKRIFTPKKQQQNLLDLESELDNLLQKVTSNTLNNIKELKKIELNYHSQISTLQIRMLELLDYLENREITKTKINTINAQQLISRTKQQISIFSLLATILLIITLAILFIFTTRNKKYNSLLKKAKKNAERLARSKEQFLANMSHEIRTPLNAIIGFTNQLGKSKLDTPQMEQIAIIEKASSHLLTVLNDILDFTKLQNEKVLLEKEQFRIAEVVKTVVDLLQIKAEERGNSIELQIENDNTVLSGDTYRLKQVLLNLIGNSIKFTENGEIKVTVQTKPLNTRNSMIHIGIKDTGVGISAENQSRIFEEFEQVSSSLSSQGTGLGLAIVKKIVDLHNGHLTLESSEGKGAEIAIEIPYEKVAENEIIHTTKKENKSAVNFQGIAVLIADDEIFNLKLLEAILKPYTKRILQATNGQEALKHLEKEKVDIALLDIKMPGLTGWEIVKSVREKEGPNQNTPMIALTATVAEEAHVRGMKAGFNQLMRKPFLELELLEAMASEMGIPPQSLPSAKEKKRPASFSTKSLEQLGDEAFVRDMLQTFVESSTKNLQTMHEKLSKNQLDEVADLAHKTVAPARHLDAEELVICLKEIETTAQNGEKPPADLIKKTIEIHDALMIGIAEYLN